MPKRAKAPSRKCKQPTMAKGDVETRDEEGVERHIKEEEISDDENEGDATSDATSSISYPNFKELKSRRNRTYKPVVDVASSTFRSHDTVFQ
eukprot:14878807-Ditylum_brightwellii.AAC.1